MTLYILRHGETEYNRRGLVQGSGIDADLNDTGRQQAQSFYERYADEPFDLIVTSRLRRTHQTVQRFIDRGLPWIELPELNEISWGEHEGQQPTPGHIAAYEAVVAAWSAGDLDAALPGGESARSLGERVGRFIEWLKTRREQRVLVCTHGRTMRCLISMLKGASPADMERVPHANTGCYVVHLRDGQRFEIERENCVLHLD
jgi:broad specificity phosphatase PhoE